MRFKSVLFPTAAIQAFWKLHQSGFQKLIQSSRQQALGQQQEATNATQTTAQAGNDDEPESNQPATSSSADQAHPSDSETHRVHNHSSSSSESRNSRRLALFIKTYQQNRKGRGIVPRGAIVFTGVLEMKCSKGRLLLDVFAEYDPVNDRFHTTHVHLRASKPYSQRPKGGE
jgi:hypothetical protein